jgi:hypothetical protein
VSRKLVLDYPHLRPSFAPKRLKAESIWAIADAARMQICGNAQRARIDISQIIKRTRHLIVNGIAFEAHWELSHPVVDEMGCPVAGAVEYDESFPQAALISINSDLLRGRDDLACSTVAHELGHAIFDTPSWIQHAVNGLEFPAAAQMLHFQPSPHEEPFGNRLPVSATDWCEWRANEFMGAFLAPRNLLHRHLHKQAAGLKVPLVEGSTIADLPIVNERRAGSDAIEALLIELAEIFGVSIEFIRVRLHKYQLLAWR